MKVCLRMLLKTNDEKNPFLGRVTMLLKTQDVIENRRRDSDDIVRILCRLRRYSRKQMR